MTILDAISLKILHYCKENHLSLSELALKCKVCKSTLYQIVNKKQFPRISTIQKMSEGMGLTPYTFFSDILFQTINN